jgi:hypothetical protein
MGMIRSLLIHLAAVCLVGAVAFGQPALTVRGTVIDETGAGIPRVTLTFIGSAGVIRDASTDPTGRFVIEQAPPGEYVLHVYALGFQPVERPVTVQGESMRPLTIELKVALANEIVVTGRKGDVATLAERNADAQTFDRDALRTLPLDGQNVTALVSPFLAPSASLGGNPSVVIDGVEGDALELSASSVRRVNLNTNPYSAEQRRAGKGRIEIVSDHGSQDHFHAVGALYLRDGALQARNVFAETDPDLSRRLFEGSFSGPTANHRLTFFTSWNRLHHDESAIVQARTLAGPVVENVPTGQLRTNWYGRVDLHPNPLHSLTFRFDAMDDDSSNQGVGGLRLRDQARAMAEQNRRFQFLDHRVVAPFVTDLRAVVSHEEQGTGQPAPRPAISVEGAFVSGPSQTYRSEATTTWQLQNVSSVFYKNHSLRFGGNVRRKAIAAIDGSNFGGTFTFSSLDRFAVGAPAVYSVNRGRPGLDFSMMDAFAFAQDDVSLGSHLSVMLGVRDDWQSRAPGADRPSPRVSVAYAATPDTILRGGAGLFRERLPQSAISRALLDDGARIREVVVSAPGFPDPFAAGATVLPPASIVTIAPNLTASNVFQTSLGVERSIRATSQVTLEYQFLRGMHLLRSRNVNAPLAASTLRPDPAWLNVNQIESTARMRSHNVSVSFNTQVTNRFKATAQYTYSRSADDSSGPFALPADNHDLAAEFGPSDYDRRQRFNSNGTFALGGSVSLGVVASLWSGAPFNITTGSDDNGDTVVNDRPAGVTRNSGRGPGFAQIDLRLMKIFALAYPFNQPGRRAEMQMILDAFNVFDRTNYVGYIGVQSSPWFGRANMARQPRTIQLAFKYRF